MSDVINNNTFAYRKTIEYELYSLKDIQDAKSQRRVNRGQLNKIIKCLPPIIKNAIDNNLLHNTERSYCIPLIDKVEIPTKITSSQIQHALKTTLKKTKLINSGEIYKRQEWTTNNHDWLFKLWKIKNPTIRHYRYKAILKDIYSKERMKRFGMTDNDRCEICNQIETVEHQLFTCRNAVRIRDLARSVTGKGVESLYDLLRCTSKTELEICKALIIKCSNR